MLRKVIFVESVSFAKPLSQPMESHKVQKMRSPSSAPKKAASELTAPKVEVHLSTSAKDGHHPSEHVEEQLSKRKMEAKSSSHKKKVEASPPPPAAAKDSQCDA
jgi:hypothetical protein